MRRTTDGYALILALTLLTLLGMIFFSYSVITRSESVSSRNTARSTAGFYSAEAALNARAERVRAKFIGYSVPSGVPPTSNQPCAGTNLGSGDFACETVVINNRRVTSYVVQLDTRTVQIGAGERYAGLNAEETQFVVYAQALNPAGNPEAIAQLTFRSRLVPLFQFAVFFNKDLEFDNTASLDLAGPVYSNGNIFLDAGPSSTLHIGGQVISSGDLYRGGKSRNACNGTVNVDDLSSAPQTVSCSGSRRGITAAELPTWGGQMAERVSPVVVPDASSLQPLASSIYWAQADIRVVLKPQTVAGNVIWTPELQDINGNTSVSGAVLAALCPAATGASNTFLDNREAQYWNNINSAKSRKQMLEVDMGNLLTCIRVNSSSLNVAPQTGTSNDRGLVIYLTVKDGVNSQTAGTNNYGVRITNAATLHALNPLNGIISSRADLGVTVATDQAMFVQGNYNTNTKVPAALLSDSMNVLSSNWNTPSRCYYPGISAPVYWSPNGYYTYNVAQAAIGDQKSYGPMNCRLAAATTVNAAVLSGTDTSGYTNDTTAVEGLFDASPQSGGVHNMMRFHEDWGGNTPTALASPAIYTYLGSLVSLGRPQHVQGQFQVGSPIYQPPKRNWAFDTDFRNASKLPPLSPRFIYIKQENFVRKFEQ